MVYQQLVMYFLVLKNIAPFYNPIPFQSPMKTWENRSKDFFSNFTQLLSYIEFKLSLIFNTILFLV